MAEWPLAAQGLADMRRDTVTAAASLARSICTFSTAPGTHSHTRSWLGVHDDVRLLFGPQSAGLQAVQLPAPTWE